MPRTPFIDPVFVNVGGGKTGLIYVCRYAGSRFKATLRLDDEPDPALQRRFGTARPSVIGAVLQLCKSKLPLITAEEKDRVIDKVKDYTATNLAAVKRCTLDAAPANIVDNQVKVYHQIYGIFGDDKEMSELFRASSKMWQRVAAANGAGTSS